MNAQMKNAVKASYKLFISVEWFYKGAYQGLPLPLTHSEIKKTRKEIKKFMRSKDTNAEQAAEYIKLASLIATKINPRHFWIDYNIMSQENQQDDMDMVQSILNTVHNTKPPDYSTLSDMEYEYIAVYYKRMVEEVKKFHIENPRDLIVFIKSYEKNRIKFKDRFQVSNMAH